MFAASTLVSLASFGTYATLQCLKAANSWDSSSFLLLGAGKPDLWYLHVPYCEARIPFRGPSHWAFFGLPFTSGLIVLWAATLAIAYRFQLPIAVTIGVVELLLPSRHVHVASATPSAICSTGFGLFASVAPELVSTVTPLLLTSAVAPLLLRSRFTAWW